jgi:hypothetical protein
MRAKGLSDLKNGYESASATILVRRAHWSVSNNRRICLGTLGYEPKELKKRISVSESLSGVYSSGCASLELPDNSLQDAAGHLEYLPFLRFERFNLRRQRADAASPSREQQPPSRRCGRKMNIASVSGTLLLGHEAEVFERIDNTCHGGGADLFYFGQISQRDRATKHYDRES